MQGFQTNEITSKPYQNPVPIEVESDITAPENHERCPNCHAYIPLTTFERHLLFCQRNNVLCEICGKILKKTDKDNHIHCDICLEVRERKEKEIFLIFLIYCLSHKKNKLKQKQNNICFSFAHLEF